MNRRDLLRAALLLGKISEKDRIALDTAVQCRIMSIRSAVLIDKAAKLYEAWVGKGVTWKPYGSARKAFEKLVEYNVRLDMGYNLRPATPRSAKKISDALGNELIESYLSKPLPRI